MAIVNAYSRGDLVWAKMKGFPPWPATITSVPRHSLRDPSSSRYGVLFFGTRETAQMKPNELFPYLENRTHFEVRRKHRGFNEGLEEIRVAAGLDDDDDVDAYQQQGIKAEERSEFDEDGDENHSVGPTSSASPNSSLEAPTLPPLPPLPTQQISVRRSRRISERSSGAGGALSSSMANNTLTTAVALIPTRTRSTSRNSSTSGGGGRIAAGEATKKGSLNTSGSSGGKRQRMTSISSSTASRSSSAGASGRRIKRVSYASISERLLLDDFGLDYASTADRMLTSESDPLFVSNLACSSLNATNNSQFSLFDEQLEEERLLNLQRRRTRSSRLFDDFLSPTPSKAGSTPRDGRSRSASTNGRRSRLISGLSEFDDLIFNPNELMAAIDSLPSAGEESDRPITPEEPLSMPAPLKCCYECGCQCELISKGREMKWRCTSRACMKWNGIHKAVPFEKSTPPQEVNLHPGPQPDASTIKQEQQFQPADAQAILVEDHLVKSEIKEEGDEPANNNVSIGECHRGAPSTDNNYVTTTTNSTNGHVLVPPKRCGRPKSYKVEKTPPMMPSGLRHCYFCSGQVRPQMCGGNKHRWRCVDKRCRKWYGWVRSDDEIPRDLGRKGKWKEFTLVVTTAAAADAASVRTGVKDKGQKTHPIGQRHVETAIDLGDEDGLVLKSSPINSLTTPIPRAKRKYAKRRPLPMERKMSTAPKRPVSPLNLRQMTYKPSAMEQRSRWWSSERRTVDVSPERALPPSSINEEHSYSARVVNSTAAAFRLIGNSMLTAAAATPADEVGTVTGTLDLLMDTMCASMAPLLSLVGEAMPPLGGGNGTMPLMDEQTTHTLWNASSVHTPIF